MPMPSDPATHHRKTIISDGAPVDEEEGGDGADVKRRHGNGGDPVRLAIGGLAAVDIGNGDHVGN